MQDTLDEFATQKSLFESSKAQHGNGCKWRVTENGDPTKLLLAELLLRKDMFYSGRCRKELWEEVHVAFLENGYTFTQAQLSSKLDSLKRRYKGMKDDDRKSGNDGDTWVYLDDMDKLFWEKTWVEQSDKSWATNDGPESPGPPPSTTSSDSSMSGKGTKRKQMELVAYLFSSFRKETAAHRAKKRKMSMEAEKRKQARHKERMEVQRELIDVLRSFQTDS